MVIQISISDNGPGTMYTKIRFLLSSLLVVIATSALCTPIQSALATDGNEFGNLYTPVYPTENKRVYLNDLIYECNYLETTNCISQISIRQPDGSLRPLKFQKLNYVVEGSLCSPNCKKKESVRQGEQTWIDPTDNASYVVRSTLVLPGSVFSTSFSFSISQFGLGFKSALSNTSFVVNLRLNNRFQYVTAALLNTEFSVENSGGNYLYSISGDAIRQPQFKLIRIGDVVKTPNDYADYSSIVWSFSGTNTNKLSDVYTDCKDDFVVFTSNSATELTPPHWDGSKISWELAGVHFWEDGETIIGFYETSIPTYLFKCAFGLNEDEIQSSISFEVSDVLNNQTATHTVSVRNHYVNIKSFGFHFSTVRISMKTQAKKQIKIIKSQKFCIKGTSRRTPSKANPPCPKGWRISK